MANKKRHSDRSDPNSELRALLGRIRSRGFKINDRQRAYLYRTGLQRVLISARVGSDRPLHFFNVLRTQTQLDAVRFSRQPIGHDYLNQLLESESLPVESEIAWIGARLNYEKETVGVFLHHARSIQESLLSQDVSSCIEQLEACENDIGISLWSTELKLGLIQAQLGQDAQKKILREVRASRRKGMWPYLANAASVRAEPSVSISWFLEETRRRLDRLKGNEFTEYMKYRGLGIWPSSQAACARVLRAEQSHHIADLYETFVSYLQEGATRKLPEETINAMRAALALLHDVNDPRLRKLEFALTGKRSSLLPIHLLDLPDALLSGAPASVAVREEIRGAISAESSVALAIGVQRTSLANSERSSNKMVILRGLAEAFRRTGVESQSVARASEKLRKLVHVFSAVPMMKSLLCILEGAASPHTEKGIKKLRLAALNSNEWGLLDLIGFADHPAYPELRAAFAFGATVSFTDQLAGFSPNAGISLREDAESLAKAAFLYLASKSDMAVAEVKTALRSENRLIAAQAAIVALNAYARTGEVTAASELVAREHVDHGVDPESMPVREVFQDLEWRDLREAAESPELSIALSLIQSTEGDDRLKTYRRFALETLVKRLDMTRPSELRSVALGWRPSMLVHFLSKVCTAAMLDMLPAIRSSREVLEERREICGYLAAIDKANADQHQQELLEISRELTVLDGLRTIDGSRVHVDTDSLSRRLKVDLAESFQRYMSLIEGAEKSIDGISSIIKDLSRRDHPPEYLLSMPVSEADELLVSMIVRSKERFLLDVPHGLDSYISKRIRHGSIVGVVRAPAEREGIVAKRNLDGSYRSNGTWADGVADAAQRAALSAAIRASSKAIDEHLIRLKDVLLHVKSETKPHGLFECPLTAPSYLVIRTIASSDVTLDAFVDTMFKSLWAMLAASLAQAQSLLRRESVGFVSEQLQSLRAKAQKILKDPDERAAFDAAAVNASVGMQAALVAAASWFEPAESVSRDYSLEEVVDIAVASVRATKSGFDPDIKLSCGSTFSFSELALPLVCDVFYIAFGNVAAHAGGNGSPEVMVEVGEDAGHRRLIIGIENDVAFNSEIDFMRMQSKLEEIRREIRESQGVARVRSEGGSGLAKLANVVAQVEGDSLEFECTRDRFKLRFQLSYSPSRPF